MAKAKKLPSGSWRCLVYSHSEPVYGKDGKPVLDSSGKQKQKRIYESFTSDDPSPAGKREAEYKAAQFALKKMARGKENGNYANMELKEAMMQYCDIKSNILSPSTLRGYRQLINNAYTDISTLPLRSINKQVIQSWINDYSKTRSPKTVSNAYGFLTSVLYYFIDDIIIKVTLPQKKKYDAYVPNDAEIETLINYYKDRDRDMLIASCLAAFGTLRRSEICGLHRNNIEGCVVHIRQVMVMNDKKIYILKDYAKNYSSARDITMPEFMIDLLPADGPIVKINPSQITLRHISALKKLNINKFRFHDLRHYSASIMHALGVPDQYIMQRGGWSSDRVLKNIYRGTIEDYNQKFEATVFDHYEMMQHNIQHKK